MEFIIILQIIFIFVILIANLLCVFLPLKVVSKGGQASGSNAKTHRVIGFCNSLSAGVFLGTCYLQLIPYVETKFSEVFEKAELDLDYSNLTAQCMIMAGFFLIVAIEQTVHAVQNRKGKSGYGSQTQKGVRRTPEIPDGYDASSDSSETLDSEADDPRRKMLPRPKSNPHTDSTGSANVGFTAGQNHSHVDTEHGHLHAMGGHGHSHIIDVAQENSGLRCILLLAALSVHSLFEGMAVGLQDRVPNLINLFIGVLVHECLVAFAIGISLAQQHMNRSLVIKLGITFSLMIPVGMAMGLAIGEIHGVKAEFVAITIQALAAGTFVYVIFLEVLPAEINSHDDKILKFLFLFLGFFIILCLRLGLRDS